MARVGLWTVNRHFNPVEDFCQFDVTRKTLFLVQSSLGSSSVQLWARVWSLSAGQVAETTQTHPFGVLQAQQRGEVATDYLGSTFGLWYLSARSVPSSQEGAATQPESVLLLPVIAFL